MQSMELSSRSWAPELDFCNMHMSCAGSAGSAHILHLPQRAVEGWPCRACASGRVSL